MLFMNKRVEEVKLGKNNELIWILEHPIDLFSWGKF